MLDWIESHATLISAGVQIVTALVWVVYLQVFVVSFRRQRRSNILINRVAGNHDRGHLLVGNMGAEPIYVSAVMVEPRIGGQLRRAMVTDSLTGSDGLAEDQAVSQSRQGPLNSAETRDIGALGDLLDVALADMGCADRMDEVDQVTITAVAEGTFDRHLVAGQRVFGVHHDGDRRRFLPTQSQTRQIRSRRARRALSARLDTALREEAEAVRSG
ncbi:hypothetical protein [Pseudooceanicola onchidii]|uniref:hypothetical protein n=1 Tax=Pseudooceanicola onchidii TaxID=2562279 RepID=UPI0010AA1071|nr:hypothetical protein [Pseudooceanicola onchidii]